MSSIKSLTVPGTVVLEGTGLTDIPSRVATAGTWKADEFEGSTQDLVNLYATDGTDPTAKLYTFAFTAGFKSDAKGNVRWSYEPNDGSLLIYVVDVTGDTSVSAAAKDLPWLDSVNQSDISSITVRATDDKGNTAYIAPASLDEWFKDYTGLISFDGKGFDVSDTKSFASLFSGDVNLANVDLSGWEMPAVARDSFFGNCVALSILILTKGVILANTGLGNDLGKLNASTGSWDANTGWFGATDNLVIRYPEGTAFDDVLGDDPITYKWHPSQIAGRFANDNVWWKYENKTLTLGITDATSASGLTIIEEAGDQPWLGVVTNGKAVKEVITKVSVTGGIKPATLASWFMGYTNLESFDGSGMDVSETGSFVNLFYDLKNLKTVNLSNWVMQADNPRGGMFTGCSSLTTLTLGKGVILGSAAGFDANLDGHGTSDGSWLTEGETWFGSTEDLSRRYPTSDASLDKVAYTWSSGMKSGRFISNDNAWWKYDEVKGILTVGVTVDANSANQSRVVTEVASVDGNDYSKLLPWENVISGYKSKILKVVFQGEKGNRLQPTNPEGWFEGYSKLSSFDGSGLDLSHITDEGGKPSLARFFMDCPQLGHADGLDQWDVSEVTDLSNLFANDRLLIAEPAIDKWITSKVKDFSYLFLNAVDLTEINKVAGWNVSSATNFTGMFEGAENVVKLNLRGWTMTRVEKLVLTDMLKGAGHIMTLVLGPGVVLEGAGFEENDTRGDTKGSWDRTDDPAGEGKMWFGTTGNLVTRYPMAHAVITDEGTHTYVWADGSLRGRFASNDNAWWTYDGKLKQLVIGTTFQDTGHDLTVTETAGTRWLTSEEIPEGTSQQPWVDIIEEKNCYSTVNSIVVKAGASLNVTNIYKWFAHYEALKTIDVSGLVLPTDHAHANLDGLFESCLNLGSIDGLDKLDVSAATSFDRMFAECRALTEVTGVSDWVTSNVTSMADLFYNDGVMLSLVDLGSWDTSKVTDFRNVFWGNKKLRTLNLHNWNMLASVKPTDAQEGVTYSRDAMLAGCVSLSSLTLGPNAILTGTGFDDTLSSRTPVDGSWDASDKVWFGSSSNVNARYPESKEGTVNGVEGANLPTDELTYSWADGSLRGRFQNDNAWWKFSWDDSGKTAGTLWIGADAGTNKVITERQDDTGGMPWVSVIAQAAGVTDGTTLVTKVVTDADHIFQIANPADDKWVDWFCGYENLVSFDGTGLDTSNLTTLANLFKGCVKLATVTGLGKWDVELVTTFESLFDSCEALKTVSGTENWKTDSLKNLKRTFAGASALTDLTTVATWDTSKVIDFTQTFAGDYSLATLFLDNWNMTAASTLYLAGLFEGCKNLSKMRLGKDVVLEGTGFDNALAYDSDYTREAQDGSWNADTDGWFGSSSNLAACYPASKAGTVNGVAGADLPSVTITYDWAAGQLAGRFKNDHTWWKFDDASGTLTIGADATAQNKAVAEPAAELPWSSAITDVHYAIPQIYGNVHDYNIAGAWHDYRYGRIRSIATQNNVAPQNLEGWFAGYDLLGYTLLNSSSYGSFDGRGMDVSSTSSFANLFQDDAYLAKVDLSTWTMREDANTARAGMFSGCTRLGDTSMGGGLTVGAGTILEGSGISGLSTRLATQGRWLLTVDDADLWFDSSAELETRYGLTTTVTSRFAGTQDAITARPSTTYTYTWDTSTLGGRFRSNQNAWWTFTPTTAGADLSNTTTAGTLRLGADGNDGDNKTVTEDATTESPYVLPWIAPLGGADALGRITGITSTGRLAPTSLYGWFRNLSGLTSFDGNGLNTSATTSMAYLFANDAKLATITNIAWGTSNVESFAYAFSNLASLGSIDLSAWNVSKANDFNHMFYLDKDHQDSTTALRSIILSEVGQSWNMLRTDGTVLNLEGMFTGLRYLTDLKISKTIVLEGSGIDDDMYYHGPSDGSWGRYTSANDNLIGTSSSFAGYFPRTGSAVDQTITYTWFDGVFKGNFSLYNSNVWWRYDRYSDDGTKTPIGRISVGLLDKAGKRDVNQYEGTYQGVSSTLPWRTLIKNPNPEGAELEKSGATPVYAFYSSAADGVIVPLNLYGWFKGYTLLTTFDGSGIDFSQAVSLEDLFSGDTALTSVIGIGVSGAPSAKNTSLAGTFANDTNLTALSSLAGWDTSNVESYVSLFQGDKGLTGLDLSSWNMDRVKGDPTKVADMLAGCTGLRTLTLNDTIILGKTGFDDSLATLTPVDGMWVYTNGDGDEQWFDTTSKLAHLYDPANTTDHVGPQGMQGLTGTLTYTWDSTRLGGRFPSNPNAWWKYTKSVPEGGDQSRIGLLELGADGQTTDPKYVYETSALKPDNSPSSAKSDGWGKLPWQYVIPKAGSTYDATSTAGFDTAAITKVTARGHLAPVDLSGWFKDHTSLTSFTEAIDGNAMDTNLAVSFASLFEGCSSLTEVKGLDGWNTSQVLSLASMFKNASSLVTIPSFAKWDTSKVTDFSSMFEGASSLTYATGIGSWTTTAGTTWKQMFKGARSLLSVDFSNWDMQTNSAKFADDYLDDMMFGCVSLASVTLGDKFAVVNKDETDRDPEKAAPTRTLAFDKGSYGTRQYGMGYSEFDFYAPTSSYLTITFSDDSVVGWCDGSWWHGHHTDTLYVYNGAGTALGTVQWNNWASREFTSTDGVIRLVLGYGCGSTYRGILKGTLTSDAPIYELLGTSADAGTEVLGVMSSGYWTRSSDGWLGSWGELMDSYDTFGGPTMAGTYTWASGKFGGRFQNLNAWWTYDQGALSLHGNGTAGQSIVTEKANFDAATGDMKPSPNTTAADILPFDFLRSWATTYYGNQSYIKAITTEGQLAPQNFQSWFDTYQILETFDGSGLDTSKATSFQNLFAHDAALTKISGVGTWDTSQSTSFAGTFYDDGKLDADGIASLAGWKVEASTSFANMFYQVTGLTDLTNLGGWTINTTAPVDMNHMFYGTRATALDRLASWDTTKVTDYSYMFAENPDLKDAKAIGAAATDHSAATSWVVSAGANLSYLFYHDTGLEDVDVSAWNMKRSNDVTDMLLTNTAAEKGKVACSLKNIRLGADSVLTGTGISNDLTAHDVPDGEWIREDNGWFDSSSKLALLYPATGTARFADKAYTYSWNVVPGGRLTYTHEQVDGTWKAVDNSYVYWRYLADRDADGNLTGTGQLAIGVTDYDSSADTNPNALVVVNRYDELPWLDLDITGTQKITSVSINGGVRIVNPEHWFDGSLTGGTYGSKYAGYRNIQIFDGSGIDFSGIDFSGIVREGLTTPFYDAQGQEIKHATPSLEAFLKSCTGLTTLSGLQNWISSNVTSIKDIFANDSQLTTLGGIGYWTVGGITDMSGAFQGATSLKIEDLEFLVRWDVSKVQNFDNMFNGATSLSSLEYLKDWRTLSATSMAGMFMGDTALQTVNLTGWSVSHVTDFSNMFRGDSGIKTMDISTWDMLASVAPATADGLTHSRSAMFAGLTSLEALTVGQNVILYNAGFVGSDNNTVGISTRKATQGRWQLRGGLWYDLTDRLAERYGEASRYASTEANGLAVYDWQGGKPGGHLSSNQSAWWTYDPDSGTLTIGLDEGTTDPDHMQASETYGRYVVGQDNIIQGKTKLKDDTHTYTLPWRDYGVALESNTYRVVFRNQIAVLNPRDWFYNYYYLTEFDGGAMDASQAQNFSEMFYADVRLTTLTGLTNWDVSSGVNFYRMFRDTDSLKTLDGIAGWKTTSAQNLAEMFYSCNSLTDATAIRNWDTSKVISMQYLFGGNGNLKKVDFRDWDMRTAGEGVSRTSLDLTYMFADGTGNLTEITLGPGSVVAGSYLLEIRPDNSGRWYLPNNTWFGNTSALIGRYPTDGNALAGPLTYTWDPDHIGGYFASNPTNAWWTYTRTGAQAGLLTIGTNTGSNKLITETGSQLPWDLTTCPATAAGVGKAAITAVAIDGAPVIQSPAHWFDGYANLVSLDGTGLSFDMTSATKTTSLAGMFANDPKLTTLTNVGTWDTSNITDMSGAFQNDYALASNGAFSTWDTGKVENFADMFAMGSDATTQLASLDLTGWDMRAATTVEGMLAGCKNLQTLLLDDESVLEGSGLDDTLATRAATDGRWVLGQKDAGGNWTYGRTVTDLAGNAASNTWWGNSAQLSATYKLGGNTRGSAMLYTWDDKALGGRFASDERAWWVYDQDPSSATYRTLTLGTQDDEAIAVEEKAAELPWIHIVPLHQVLAIASQGQLILPEDASQWFASSQFANREVLSDDQRDLTKWTIGSYMTVKDSDHFTVDWRSNWSWSYSSSITIVKGKTYTLSAWVKNDPYSLNWGSTSYMFGLELNDCSDIYRVPDYWPYRLAFLAFDYQGTGDWTYETASFVAPADGTYYLMLNHSYVNYQDTVNFWLREVSLVEDAGYTELNSFDGEHLDVSRVTNASQMFAGDRKLSQVTGVLGWQTQNFQNMHGMFEDDYALANITDMRNWKTQNVTDMGSAFADARSLETNEGIVKWDTSKVTDFSHMFYGDRKLATLDLSQWKMQRSTNRADMIGVPAGMTQSLTTVIASPSTVLTGSGMDNDLTARTNREGVWRLQGQDWFDDSDGLAERYPVVASNSHKGTLTYVWDDTILGGRFAPDSATWWKYIKPTGEEGVGHELVLGSDDTADTNVHLVAESGAANLPWVLALGYEPGATDDETAASLKAAKDQIHKVTSKGGINIQTPANWFEDYDELTSFDGSNMNVQSAESLANMFARDEKLEDVTGLTNWSTTAVKDFTGTFRGDALLGDDDLAQLKYWAVDDSSELDESKRSVTMSAMFQGCTSLTTLDALDKWDTSKVTSFASMFADCTGLTDARGIGKWTVTGADLSDMFSGDSALKQVDFGTWDMRSSKVTGLLASCSSLEEITAGEKTVLAGTGLSDSLTGRTKNDGSWERQGTTVGDKWADSSSKLADLYTAGSSPSSKAYTYKWGTILRGRFANEYVWWTYNTATDTLTIGYDGPEGADKNILVTEDAGHLPWLALATPDGTVGGYAKLMKHVVFESRVGIKNPAGWFKNHTDLLDVTTVDEKGASTLDLSQATSLTGMFEGDISLTTIAMAEKAGYADGTTNPWNIDSSKVTSFASAFSGDRELRELDLTGWHMTGKDVKGLLAGTASLKKLTLEPDAVLEDTGLSEVASKALHAGVWKADGQTIKSHENNPDLDGATSELVYRYPATGGTQTGVVTYEWVLENRFDSNPYAWWRFDEDTKTLYVGVYDNDTTYGKVVTEYGDTSAALGGHKSNLPWRDSLDPRLVEHVVLQDGIAPANLSGWFSGYYSDAYGQVLGYDRLQSFQGSGYTDAQGVVHEGANVSATTSFAEMFKGDAALQELDIHTWDMVSDRGP